MNEQQILAQLRDYVTSDMEVSQAVAGDGEAIVTLVRGCSESSGKMAANTKTPGGVPKDPSCGRPSEAQAISQVGGSQPGKPQQKLPEFTAVADNTSGWARRGGWLVVQIRAKYLVRGDVGQSGWVCLPAAPLENATFIKHPNPEAANIPNAD